jgi:hypothetical protein
MLSYFSRKRNSPQKSRTSTIKNMFSRALGSVIPSRARIHDVADVADVAIELSTPRSDTPTDTRHRTASQRSASQRSATQRSATPTETRHRTATQRTATPTDTRHRTATQTTATPTSSASRSARPTTAAPRSASPRTDRPSVRRVQQEIRDVFNTMSDATRSEAIALNDLNLKKSNTQNEINKINRQIFLLEQMLRQRRTLEEKNEYRRQIKILTALKLELKQNLAQITIELQSAIETMQKKYSKKGGTRKRRKYAKKH